MKFTLRRSNEFRCKIWWVQTGARYISRTRLRFFFKIPRSHAHRITRITGRPQNRGHSLYPKEGHKSRHRFFPQHHESGFFRSAMLFDPAYIHPETAWVSFVMHIRWTVCFLSFRAQSEQQHMTCINFDRFQLLFLKRRLATNYYFFGVVSEELAWGNTMSKVTAICC